MNDTYDPIVRIIEPRAVRVRDKLATPAIDTALVLEPMVGELRLVEAGKRVPGAWIGRYRRVLVVDLRRYALGLSVDDMPSADPGFTVSAKLTFSCQVVDPIMVARSGIRDMTAALRSSLVRVMQDVVREYDISEFRAASAALNEALETVRGGSGVALGGYLAELTSSSGYHDTTRGIRIERIQRDAMLEVVDGGRRTFVAQAMVKADGDPMPMLAMDAEAVERDKDRLLEVMRETSGEGADLPDSREIRSRVTGKLLGEPTTGKAPERKRLSRRDHIAASRGDVPKSLDAGPEPSVVDAAGPKLPDRPGPRVRGVQRVTPKEPDARPLPGTRMSRLRGSAAGRLKESDT